MQEEQEEGGGGGSGNSPHSSNKSGEDDTREQGRHAGFKSTPGHVSPSKSPTRDINNASVGRHRARGNGRKQRNARGCAAQEVVQLPWRAQVRELPPCVLHDAPWAFRRGSPSASQPTHTA